MKARRMTLTYLATYLLLGGVGFASFPAPVLQLFQSTGDYGDIMPRIVGMFMCALGLLIWRILKNEDWKYYSLTIYIRSAIVLFLVWIYFKSQDPMWLILTGVVLVGLIPSILVHFGSKSHS